MFETTIWWVKIANWADCVFICLNVFMIWRFSHHFIHDVISFFVDFHINRCLTRLRVPFITRVKEVVYRIENTFLCHDDSTIGRILSVHVSHLIRRPPSISMS